MTNTCPSCGLVHVCVHTHYNSVITPGLGWSLTAVPLTPTLGKQSVNTEHWPEVELVNSHLHSVKLWATA